MANSVANLRLSQVLWLTQKCQSSQVSTKVSEFALGPTSRTSVSVVRTAGRWGLEDGRCNSGDSGDSGNHNVATETTMQASNIVELSHTKEPVEMPLDSLEHKTNKVGSDNSVSLNKDFAIDPSTSIEMTKKEIPLGEQIVEEKKDGDVLHKIQPSNALDKSSISKPKKIGSATSHIIKSRDFKRYLENKGVLDILTKTLIKLYDEQDDRPEDALLYLKSNLALPSDEPSREEILEKDLESRDKTIVELNKQIDDFKFKTNVLSKEVETARNQAINDSENIKQLSEKVDKLTKEIQSLKEKSSTGNTAQQLPNINLSQSTQSSQQSPAAHTPPNNPNSTNLVNPSQLNSSYSGSLIGANSIQKQPNLSEKPNVIGKNGTTHTSPNPSNTQSQGPINTPDNISPQQQQAKHSLNLKPNESIPTNNQNIINAQQQKVNANINLPNSSLAPSIENTSSSVSGSNYSTINHQGFSNSFSNDQSKPILVNSLNNPNMSGPNSSTNNNNTIAPKAPTSNPNVVGQIPTSINSDPFSSITGLVNGDFGNAYNSSLSDGTFDLSAYGFDMLNNNSGSNNNSNNNNPFGLPK